MDAEEVTLHDDLDGQVALVTGANRGIGAVIAADLAALGATVYAGARDPDAVTAADQRPVALDVTDDDGMVAAIDRIADEAGRLDVLVNNAAVTDGGDPLDEQDPAAIDRTLRTNLHGPVHLTRHALGLLLDREGGRVVNVSSGMGALDGMGGGSPAYRVSKTGLNGLTTYLHGEYRRDGLIPNSVCPGWVRTDMGGSRAPRSPEQGADTPVWLARFAPGSPGGLFWRDRTAIDW